MQSVGAVDAVFKPLNESPSEKEGKSGFEDRKAA